MTTMAEKRSANTTLDYIFLCFVVAIGIVSLFAFAVYPQVFRTADATSTLAGP